MNAQSHTFWSGLVLNPSILGTKTVHFFFFAANLQFTHFVNYFSDKGFQASVVAQVKEKKKKL